jgi:hypothetical protein
MDKLINSAGNTANYTGTALEQFIEARLIERGYKHVDKDKFKPAIYLEQPIYTRQFHLGKSIYETSLYCDFILFHPQKWLDCLVIESKWQQCGGSVDEKYPYTVLNMKQHSAYKSILLLDGGGYKPGAETWLRQQVDDKLLHVFNMVQFQIWCNKGNL